VIGVGGQLAGWSDVHLLHITDGAPRDMRDALAAGFESRRAYAEARREELHRALACAGIPARRAQSLEVADQEASYHLAGITLEVTRWLERLRPRTVLAPAYEGGHPDHDAAAFAAQQACASLLRAELAVPERFEFPLYHERGGAMETGSFLPLVGPQEQGEEASRPLRFQLGLEARERKQRMIGCFVSQRKVLAAFPLTAECLRRAPDYDFTRAPHEGTLYYERFSWGMPSGSRWRELAAEALSTLASGTIGGARWA
jgi:N-acetylglucosamine malate deacetylase 2